MRRSLVFCLACLLVASSLAYAVIATLDSPVNTFVTWDSLEPDKWSSIWLLKRHIAPHAVIEVRPTGDSLANGIAFGVPQATYKRSANQSTFTSLLVGFDQQDPVLKKLGAIITSIETTSWNSANDPLVHTVEQNFRRLQDAYNREYVPISCYGHFFDTLYTALSQSFDVTTVDQSLIKAVSVGDCQDTTVMAERTRAKRVKELSIDQLLSEIARDKKVLFVDTREPAEFATSHIPGAVNIPMRDFNSATYEQLSQADRVISYCVKDFRGYEVARQMLDHGVDKVAVMKPHGLSGWQSLGLPITSATLSEASAQDQLTRCARDRHLCKSL